MMKFIDEAVVLSEIFTGYFSTHSEIKVYFFYSLNISLSGKMIRDARFILDILNDFEYLFMPCMHGM